MLLIIAMLTFVTIFVLLYMLLTTYVPVQGSVDMRLKALDALSAGRSDLDQELAQPFTKRVLSPVIGKLAAKLSRLAPQGIKEAVEAKLSLAGGFGGLSADKFLLLWAMVAVAAPAIVGCAALAAGAALAKVIGLMLIALVGGVALPYMMLQQKIAARKRIMQKDLPDVLDLLTVSVEAGLGFDGALAKVSEKMKGALVEEFIRVLQEIRMGVSRREALRAMGERCDVPDIALFTTALVQADQLGVSIGNVLRVQSASMRERRRQRAQESAMKAPIKMMLPLVLFIFPTIFVVLLGPAIIQIFTTLTAK